MSRQLLHFFLIFNLLISPAFYAQTFAWQKDRPLTYTDFQGKVPAQRGMEAAVTASGMKSSVEYRDGKMKIWVGNTFDASQSWMAGDSKTPYILNHEQRHFDITEIFTRKMRQRMETEIRTADDVKRKFRPVWNQEYQTYQKFQKDYDAQTNHGLKKDIQEKYNSLIDALLKETEIWAK